MARVQVTAHLQTLFPQLRDSPLDLEAASVAELVERLEATAPGVAFYICDELGRLRRHVNIFVDGEMLIDRRSLQDPLRPDTPVFIAQALSGG